MPGKVPTLPDIYPAGNRKTFHAYAGKTGSFQSVFLFCRSEKRRGMVVLLLSGSFSDRHPLMPVNTLAIKD
jgi:hypothetical protein